MFTLLSELHFWTFKNEIVIRDSDFGCFRYYEKRSHFDYDFILGKKSYCERRGISLSPSNKRPQKLKEALKEFEEILENVRVVWVGWRDPTTAQMVFTSGLVVTLSVEPCSGDLAYLSFDKQLLGKMLSDYISDVAVCSSYAVFTYCDQLVTLVDYRPAPRLPSLAKWSSESRAHTLSLVGPSGRRIGRKLSFNSTHDKLLVWWKCGRDEVYPWSPIVRDQDRANVHIYSIKNLKLELVSFYRTDADPVHIVFSRNQPNLIHSIQQKISGKGEVRLSWVQVEVSAGRLSPGEERSLPLHSHIATLALSPSEDRLLVSCIDGSLIIADSHHDVSVSTKASFVASVVCWHPDECLVAVANERAQLQFYDTSLSTVRAQLVSDDIIPANVIDVSAYFRQQPTLLNMLWSKKLDKPIFTDCFLLLHFERGPVGVVRVVGGGSPGLAADTMVSSYLAANMADRAVALLASLHWDTHGNTALAALQSVVRHLLARPLTPDRERVLERALACYHAPRRPFSQPTDQEFGDAIHDLTRKVFHHLLRYQVVEKALRLAIDLADYDLFMDVHNYCKALGLTDMAEVALDRAEQISDLSSSQSGRSVSYSSESSSTSSGESEAGGSVCSRSSCSECGAEEGEGVGVPVPAPRPPPPHRHKVKFSNTVTQINLPQEEVVSSPEEGNYNTVGLPEPTRAYGYTYREPVAYPKAPLRVGGVYPRKPVDPPLGIPYQRDSRERPPLSIPYQPVASSSNDSYDSMYAEPYAQVVGKPYPGSYFPQEAVYKEPYASPQLSVYDVYRSPPPGFSDPPPLNTLSPQDNHTDGNHNPSGEENGKIKVVHFGLV